jgi:hypothetical protein
VHRDAAALELGAGRAVEDDHLARGQPLVQGHAAPLAPRAARTVPIVTADPAAGKRPTGESVGTLELRRESAQTVGMRGGHQPAAGTRGQ